MALSILYVGVAEGTCVHRANALRQLGHRVDHVDSSPSLTFMPRLLDRAFRRFRSHLDLRGANSALLSRLSSESYDILWIDKGVTIRPQTLRRARRMRPTIAIVSYSPDNMFHPALFSIQYRGGIPLYDLHATTKSFSVEKLRARGATDVVFVDNAFDPETHRPLTLNDDERKRFGAEAGFVGMYERHRADMMWRVAESGIPVTVQGGGWERLDRTHANLIVKNQYLDGLDYARAVSGTAVNLGFLRHAAEDLQTTRSVEIPACGGFMLAERSEEHRRLFEEGREAEFFESFDELLTKCRYYLEHEDERKKIAAAGLRRCVDDGYSNRDRLAKILAHLERSGKLAG